MRQPNNPLPRLNIGIQVKSKGGVIIYDKWEPGHSWTRNAWNIFTGFNLWATTIGKASHSGMFFGSGLLTARNTLGDDVGDIGYRVGLSYSHCSIWAGYGFYNNTITDTFGVVVGTDDTPFSAEDFILGSQITHGSGLGQLAYSAQSEPVTTYNTSTKKYTQTITRVFNNNSGSSITIKEIGLISRISPWTTSTSSYYLMARDVLDTPVVVANGAQLTVTYELTSPEFTIDTGDVRPYPGDEGSGGWVSHYIDSNTLMIVAPVVGGQASSKNYRSPVSSSCPTDLDDGQANTADLIANHLSESEIAAFCNDANNASLGGFTDWYIPATNEINDLEDFKGLAPSGEEWEAEYYWSSSRRSGYVQSYKKNFDTGSSSYVSMDGVAYVRLVRQCSVSSFVPAP